MTTDPFREPGGLFTDKALLKHNKHPDEILCRDDLIEEMGRALQDIIDGHGPKNLFLYGESGLGKTAVTQYVMDRLGERADRHGIDLTVLQLNCNTFTSSYRIAVHIHNELINTHNGLNNDDQLPSSGLASDVVWKELYSCLDTIGGNFVVVFDEIDKLANTNTEQLLYEFPRARLNNKLTNADVGVIGISNDYHFADDLPGHVEGTLTEEEIEFSEYNQSDLAEILNYIVERAFRPNVVDHSAIQQAAAAAAQNRGDAREALDIIRFAGEEAEARGDETVYDQPHVDIAIDEAERARIDASIETLTKQKEFVLLATLLLHLDGREEAYVDNIVSLYEELCEIGDLSPKAERTVRSHLDSLRMRGVLKFEEINRGGQKGGGRKYVWKPKVDNANTILELMSGKRLRQALPRRYENHRDMIGAASE